MIMNNKRAKQIRRLAKSMGKTDKRSIRLLMKAYKEGRLPLEGHDNSNS